MKISKLYVKDFLCYDDVYIDFMQFSSALIVGKTENNNDISNGVGKTTIFRALEYVLFNYSDVNLENIIRDDMERCSITLDFIVASQEYRLTRTRTRKGTTDTTLFKRTTVEDTNEEAYHQIKGDRYFPVSDTKYWSDISGRRAGDTEKEVIRLIKVNLKTFRIFVHFMQRDLEGLTSATPEKRKLILKDALNLGVYSKLEKLAKDKSTVLVKEADKLQTLIEGIGKPDQDIIKSQEHLILTEQKISAQALKIQQQSSLLITNSECINQLNLNLSTLEEKFSNAINQDKTLTQEKFKLQISVKEYTTKKTNAIQSAKNLIEEVKKLEEERFKLSGLDFTKTEELSNQITANKERIAQLNLILQQNTIRIDKLKKPLPPDGECEECRNIITPAHREFCQTKLNQELTEKQKHSQETKQEATNLNSENVKHQHIINQLTSSKQQLSNLNSKIDLKKSEIEERKASHSEYKRLLEKFQSELNDKTIELEQVKQDLKNASVDELQLLRNQIQQHKQEATNINNLLVPLSKEQDDLNNTRVILQHQIRQRTEDLQKKTDYQASLTTIQSKLALYPNVIQAFSNAGIPNLIIQNVLDDLQIEANNLLMQLKPGLQLSFAIEKTKSDGSEKDTLDINYFINGKKRYFENISGAQQLAVNFSLKLGLSFLLQRMIGMDVKFLLLDEIDQSLDKASVDFFSEIVKYFQKEYTIMVITHNDRLKDKFNSAILVEQDLNMVSRAKLVSSW